MGLSSNRKTKGESATGAKGLVLIADDDKALLRVLATQLRAAGYECTAVPDGQAALDALEKEDFDVVLLDLDMPEVDGFQVLAALQKDARTIVPVVLTGVGDVANAVQAMKLGAFDFLEKPCEFELLQHAVGQAWQYRQAHLRAQQMKFLIEQWERTFDASPDPIVVTDLEGRIVRSNRATSERVGVDTDRLAGQPCHDALCGRAEARYGRAEARPYLHRAEECPFTRPSGEEGPQRTEAELWGGCFELSSAPLRDKKGETWGRLCVARDITERKRAEERLREAHAELERRVDERTAELAQANASLQLEIAERTRVQDQIEGLSSLKEQLLGTAGLAQKLKLITDEIVAVFGADFARIWMTGDGDLCDKGCVHAAATEGPHVCRDRTRCLHLVASSGRYTHIDGPHRRVPLGCYKIGRIASGAETEFVTNDVVHDSRVHNHEWAAELGLVSFAGWRLLSPEAKPIGVLALFSKQPIAPDETRLLEDLGNTTSHVIQTGLAEEELRRSRDELETHVQERTQELAESNASLRSEVERRTQTEGALRKAHNEAERLLASMSSFLIELEQDLRVSRWNAAAETTFGKPAASVIGKPLQACGIQWDWDAIVKQIPAWPIIEKAMRLREVRYRRTDGSEGFLGISINPIRTDSGSIAGCFLLGTDITERRSLELQLNQAQKLEAVGRLAAGIAHEINTPTQYVGDNIEFLRAAYESLAGLADALRRIVADAAAAPEAIAAAKDLLDNANLDYLTEQVPRAIEQSLEGVGRVSSIVQAMKEFSHPGTAEKTLVDLNQCIRSTVTVSRNEWKYVADLETDLDGGMPPVRCLPGEFNQVILNMIVNAAHAIGDVVGRGGEHKGRIAVSTRQDGDWVVIKIADTGSGIPEAIRAHIFDPFFTTKEVGRGTGQGLAIARNVVVDKHGGAISVDSEVGKGTTFTIRMPIGA